MPVEAVTYISDLNPSNPLGTGEPKSFGDDHMRNIKLALKNTFPNISGAVLPTHTELNYLDGATGVTGTGNTVRSASPTFSGTITGGTFDGNGSTLTALNATQLTSGTIPDARFPSTLPALNGSALTALNGTNIASGTVADARLSSNVPLKNAAQTFSGLNKFIAGSEAARFANDSAFISFYNTADSTRTGYLSMATSGAELNVNLNVGLSIATNNTARFDISAAGNFDFKSGTVTTNNASSSEVGFKGAPINNQNADYTLVLADAGKTIYKNSGGAGETVTIPANGTVAFPPGTIIAIVNIGGGALSIAITTDNLIQMGSGSTGTRTLGDNGCATIEKVASTTWVISGIGLT